MDLVIAIVALVFGLGAGIGGGDVIRNVMLSRGVEAARGTAGQLLRDAEERKVPSRIEVLVELGRLSAEDGRTIQELQQLDRDVAPDEADATATAHWSFCPRPNGSYPTRR